MTFPNNEIIINSNGKTGRRPKIRRFTLLDRALRRARQEIMAQEDASVFKALDDLAKESSEDSGNKDI